MMDNGVLDRLFDKYGINDIDRKEILNIIGCIYRHDEFKRRLSNEFLHHSDITLGEHILEDTIMTYILSKKYMKRKNSNKKYRLDISLKIAMLHDLYTLPWQNNPENKSNKFFHKHGFRHPIEAVINAINWYPELFINEDDSKMIIDGIIHHMYPLPVACFKNYDSNKLELKNYDLIKSLSLGRVELIIWSSNRRKVGSVSLCRSKYREGRIMSKADKLVSTHQIKNVSSAKALVTGKNKMLKK